MKEELGYIGKRIVSNKEKLARKTFELHEKSYEEILKNAGFSLDDLLSNRMELIQYLGESLYSDQKEIFEKVDKWAEKMGHQTVAKGIPLEKFIKTIALFRTVIWESFSKELEERKFAAITMLDVSIIINPIIDEVIFSLSQIYAEDNERKIEAAHNTLQELSVPVVPLANDVAVLPIIGEIDTYRSKLIMETSLEQSTKLELEYLIIDVSGVPIVDTVVAHSLFQVVNALRLIGVNTTITGIRPEIAQTVVSLGVDFKGVKTLASLHQALSDIGFERRNQE